MVPQRKRTQLEFDHEPPRVRPFANLFRYGAVQGPAPLVVYVGGSIGKDEYEARRRTEPIFVVDEFEKALTSNPLPRVDLIICPCPIETSEDGLDTFIEHFDRELLPALGDEPTAVGCAALSAGAGYAVHLAIVAEARALAIFGGAGTLEVAKKNRLLLEQMQRDGVRPPDIVLFHNVDDHLPKPQDFVRQLPPPLRAKAAPLRLGVHSFRDYAKNGSVADAFGFLLQRLR